MIREARLEDCEALGHIIVSATRDAFQGRVPHRCLQWLTPEESARNWARNFEPGGSLEQGSSLFVAEAASGEIMGLALLGNTRAGSLSQPAIATHFPRELIALHVLPAWQRRGVGRELVARVVRTVQREGTRRLLVRVLSENPNRPFYERLGARRLGSEPYDWEGYQTHEILYGWSDLNLWSGAA